MGITSEAVFVNDAEDTDLFRSSSAMVEEAGIFRRTLRELGQNLQIFIFLHIGNPHILIKIVPGNAAGLPPIQIYHQNYRPGTVQETHGTGQVITRLLEFQGKYLISAAITLAYILKM